MTPVAGYEKAGDALERARVDLRLAVDELRHAVESWLAGEGLEAMDQVCAVVRARSEAYAEAHRQAEAGRGEPR